jgi:hypothetical protein
MNGGRNGKQTGSHSLPLDRVKKKLSEAVNAGARGIYLYSHFKYFSVDTFPVMLMKDFSRLDVQ